MTAYFIEYDYFITDKKISTIEEEFHDFGKIKNLKIYKKKINNTEVNYYTCELNYNDYLYKYEGFFYSGKGGSVQLQFAAQAEAIEPNRKLIEELNNGFFVIN